MKIMLVVKIGMTKKQFTDIFLNQSNIISGTYIQHVMHYSTILSYLLLFMIKLLIMN